MYRKTLPAKWEKSTQIGVDLLRQAQANRTLKELGDLPLRHLIIDAIPNVALIKMTYTSAIGPVMNLLIKINNDMAVRGVYSLSSTQHVGGIAPGYWIAKLCNGAKTAEEVFVYITTLRMRGKTL